MGIIYYLDLSNEPSFYILCILTFATFILSAFSFYYRKKSTLFIPSVCILFFALGFIRVSWNTVFLNPSLLSTFEKDVSFQAELLNTDFNSQKIPRYTLKIMQWVHAPKTVQKIKKIRLKFNTHQELRPGDFVQCSASLTPIVEPASPWGHNFKRDLFFQGIEALGSIKNCKVLKSKTTFQRLRSLINQKLEKNFSKNTAPIAMALITGEKSKIDFAIRDNYTKAGLAHVLAISGLHMGLIATLIFFLTKKGIGILHLLQKLSPIFPLRKVAAATSIGITFFYLLISGCGVPALRSFCMTLIFMLGILISRNPVSLRSLTFAAFYIFIFHPCALFSVSFQLSFAAVLALISAYEKGSSQLTTWFYRLIDKKDVMGKIYAFLISIILSSILATLATTPISMAVFNQFTLQSITGNILVLPILTFWIMPSLLLCLISMLWGDNSFIFSLCDYGIELMNLIAVWVSQLPGSEINIQSPYYYFLPLYFMGLCFLCIGPQRHIRIFGCLIILGSGLLFHNHTLPIGYISHDRKSMGFYEHPYFYVTSSTHSEFTTHQWIQNLGIPLKYKKEIPTPLWRWKYFHILNLPTYKKQQAVLEQYPDLLDYPKNYLPLLSNGYIKNKLKLSSKDLKNKNYFIIDAEDIKNKGSAFIFSDGTIHFSKELKKNRPWNF